MRVGMADIQSGCPKNGCDYEGRILHRHHRRSELLFVRHFRSRKNEKKYQRLRRRYKKFDKRDITLICPECHDWIHAELYPRIMFAHIVQNRRRIRGFTWQQAQQLMNAFEEAFNKWLKHPKKRDSQFLSKYPSKISLLSTELERSTTRLKHSQ